MVAAAAAVFIGCYNAFAWRLHGGAWGCCLGVWATGPGGVVRHAWASASLCERAQRPMIAAALMG